MQNRIGSMIPAAVYVMLAAAAFAGNPAPGEDTCLAAPNATAPQGSHWYYRIDRAQQRHCWYLGPGGQKVHRADTQPAAKSAASDSPASEAPLPPPRPATAPRST